ncbi:acyclic terpene utilization AtuA family protein [Tsukamurella strandjordii]|uniref:Acyclic terpene utilization AtuA family protein n=1 Tax=Tsukamurella strandjordii TaxID=147577 RepID=A0AA90NB62_9ACTN|nr:acyclic terpene utilization AtuA family protein [Tsukamurella strandjordii]MDP0399031.1 acyclic terpene utilization AtuA family protein [Tsukamurella strandjordii]
MTENRSIRIANISGFYGDRAAALGEILDGPRVDYITGDYLAELTMLILGRDRLRDADLGYAKTFLRHLTPHLNTLADRGTKVVVNAGGLNPQGLAAAVQKEIENTDGRGRNLRVGWVDGDDLLARAGDLGVPNAVTANAYLGAFGIADCLTAGADIVITGRVTDASVILGPAIAEFGWQRTDFDALAGAVAAGHIIECGTQATGGNYAFFDRHPIEKLLHPGFPIAEIAADGSFVITKQPGTGGVVEVGTVTAQLLYEVTGQRYANPDVTLRLDSMSLAQDGDDRVAVTGVRGEAPPTSTKVATTTLGGFRNEIAFLLTGLDIERKAALLEAQLRAALDPAPSDLQFRLARTDHPNADTEAAASATLTAVAWDSDPNRVGRAFSSAAVELALATYPGASPMAPPGKGGPYGVYQAVYVPNADVPHRAHRPDGTVVDIAPPTVTQELPADPSQPGTPTPAQGATASVPLGALFGARSGDKGGSANIGVWAETDEAYAWLRTNLTEALLRELLPETANLPVRRYELPNLRAVNFVIEDLLGKGVAHGYRFDPQAKGLGEWLRARTVDLPTALLPAQPEETA